MSTYLVVEVQINLKELLQEQIEKHGPYFDVRRFGY